MKPPFKLPLRIITLTQEAVTKYRVLPDDADNIGPIVFETTSKRDAEYLVAAANINVHLDAENNRLRKLLKDLVTAIHSEEVTVSTIADETWSNVMAKARAALESETDQ